MLKRVNGKFNRKKGQGTPEYLIMVAIVIAAVLYFMNHQFQDATEDTLDILMDQVVNAAESF